MGKMTKNEISAVVLVKNNQDQISDCLRSLSWCDEIIVVDDDSSDQTIEKVKKEKGKDNISIFTRSLNDDYAAQRNFGLEKARGKWVLFIDSDEKVSEMLKKEILLKLDRKEIESEYNGFYLKRKDFFLGKWLQHGEIAHVRLLRLGRKNSGNWQGRVHEKWIVKGKIGHLENPLLHTAHQSISQLIKKINHYTDIVAQCWLEEGRRVSFLEIIIYPVGKFIQNYIFRYGFLDGAQGLIMTIMMSFHSFLCRSKLYLLKKTK